MKANKKPIMQLFENIQVIFLSRYSYFLYHMQKSGEQESSTGISPLLAHCVTVGKPMASPVLHL